jgi:hypothetical protein
MGFSAIPSSAGAKGAGTVSVGVTAGVWVGVRVGVEITGFRAGNVQFASKIMLASKRIVKRAGVRFTVDLPRL